MKYNLFIGRFQPLHSGHIKLIRKMLNRGDNVCVGLRNTNIDNDNPYTIKERKKMFFNEFVEEIEQRRLIVQVLPDIKAVCYGREVGYKIEEIRLDKETEKISATKIRNNLKQNEKK